MRLRFNPNGLQHAPYGRVPVNPAHQAVLQLPYAAAAQYNRGNRAHRAELHHEGPRFRDEPGSVEANRGGLTEAGVR